MTAETLADESSLPDEVERLHRAVSRLVDARKEMIGGEVRAAPSLYDALVGELPARMGEYGGRFNGRSLLPLWVDALDARREIDDRVKTWNPGCSSTPTGLRALASRRWRPQDIRQVRDYAEVIGSWSVAVESLLNPERVKSVSAACPVCRARWFYRLLDGEQVRQTALQLVASQGCSCRACGAFWEPSRYLFLCRLLGFALPAGVDAVSASD